MSSDEKKTGDIHVTMRDSNNIGQIGHNFIFQEPPPNPNAIWQDGKVIGAIGAEPEFDGERYHFSKLFFDGPFDERRPFRLQGVDLQIESKDAVSTNSTGGRPTQTTFWRAVCRAIGRKTGHD